MVTAQVVLTLEFTVEVAVMVAVPSERPETTPLLTMETSSFDVDHDTLLFAPLGEAVTLNGEVCSTLTLRVKLLIAREVGGTGGVIVIAHVPYTEKLSVDVALIVAVPSATPVTMPLATVATSSFDVDQATEVLALEGRAATVSDCVPLMPIEAELGETEIEVGSVSDEAHIAWVVELVPPHILHAYSG